jgi:hypothetical protein
MTPFIISYVLRCLLVSDNYLVKLFVFGKHDTILDNGYHNSGSDFSDSEKLLPITVNDTADGKQLSPKSSSSSSSAPIRTRRITLLLYCFLGLQISYLSWGLLQEKIMTTEYVIRSEFFAEGLHNRHFTAVAERLAPVPAPGISMHFLFAIIYSFFWCPLHQHFGKKHFLLLFLVSN